MTEKRYDKYNPRFRDEFGCVNDLLTGESYLCGNSAMVGERDAIDTAIVLCDLLNSLYDENEHLKIRFKEERDTAMRLGSECDNLTLKNQKLELEILRLEMIIKTYEKMDALEKEFDLE